MDPVALAERFDVGARARLSEGPVGRGKQGLVWRLDTSDGSFAVKVPFRPPREEDVQAATGLQEAAHAAGVPCPRVRRTSEGRVFARVGEHTVRLFDWVDLEPPDQLIDPGLVGEAVARLHRVCPPTTGEPDPWSYQPVGANSWDDLVARLGRAGAPFAGRLAGLRDELVALETWMEQPAVLRTCHQDLWADNVLGTRDGGVCLIDWDNSGPADPAHELGCLLFEFGRTDRGRVRELLGAYRAAGGPARIRGRGVFTMLIGQLGHIAVTAASDWLEPSPRSPRQRDAEAWVGEMLDEPHTRRLLDRLLDWALSG